MIPVAIIGAGKIAQGFDNPMDDIVLTHVKAYQRHGGFEVVAVCDSDAELAIRTAEKWGIRHAVSQVEELRDLHPAVVSICTPDETHEDMLASCLDLPLKLVFCEKPIGLDHKRSNELVRKFQQANIGLMVNYSRRWSDPVRECRKIIDDGGYGKICSISGRYCRGWFHNGSHIVDLICSLFNPSTVGGGLLRKDNIGKGDFHLTGSAVLTHERDPFPFFFECMSGDQVSHFELKLLFERGSFWIGERNGTVWQKSGIIENALYPGFYELEEGATVDADPSDLMSRAIDNIYRFLDRGETLRSNGVTALETLNLCEAICSLPEIVDNSIWQS